MRIVPFVVCSCGNLVVCEESHKFDVLPCPECRGLDGGEDYDQ